MVVIHMSRGLAGFDSSSWVEKHRFSFRSFLVSAKSNHKERRSGNLLQKEEKKKQKMVGYAEPCPHCANNKRRRSGSDHHHAFSALNPCLQTSAESFPSAAPPKREASMATNVAQREFGEQSFVSLTPQVYQRRRDSNGGSSSSVGDMQLVRPAKMPFPVVAVDNAIAMNDVGLEGSPDPSRGSWVGESSKNAAVKKQNGAVAEKLQSKGKIIVGAREEPEDVAKVCINCKCGRMREFCYRQKP
ncbi:uncharacterized protein LOC144714831 [Wolffia australiana]